MKLLSTLIILSTSAFSLLGCDAQADSEYRGEPLATVRGSVVTTANVQTSDLRTAVVNYNFLVDDSGMVEGARVVGSFPAEFRLDLLTPPPAAALNDFTQGGKRPKESRFSTGYLAVIHSGKDVNTDPDSTVAGIASDFILVYVERDVEPGTDSARFLGGELKAGYHLMRYVPMSETERNALLAECDPSQSVKFPNPGVCGSGDATDRLVVNPDEFASEVKVELLPSGAEIKGGNIF